MLRFSFLAIAGVFVAICGAASIVHTSGQRVAPAAQRAIVVTNVTIVDVVSGARQHAMTVVIEDGQIADIGARARVPQGAMRVEGAGKFLMPGL